MPKAKSANKSNEMKRCNFEVNAALLEKFQNVCEAKLTTSSLVFRHFMKTYVDEFERESEIQEQIAKKSKSRR